MLYRFTRQKLKDKKATNFKEGDVIKTGNYYIFIKYGEFNTPALCAELSNKSLKKLDCVPGCGRPYYIDDFLNK